MEFKLKKGDKVYCKVDYGPFKKGEHYKVKEIHSIFSEDDYITIKYFAHMKFRFKLKDSTFGYIEDFIDSSLDPYLYNYFIPLKEERKLKLNEIEKRR